MSVIPHPAPREVCILRLSAIGDTCHVLALVRRLQQAWPATRFTWVIGKVEAKLIGLAADIDLIPFDKRGGAAEYLRIAKLLRLRRFDLLMHLQLALRASALSLAVRAPLRLGFDRARAREAQWLFTNRRIAPRRNEHVLDALLGFADALGVPASELRWNLPLPASAVDYANAVIPDSQPTLVISPCSSHPLRNWRAEYYARVAEHAAGRHKMRVVVVGSPAARERRMAAEIVAQAGAPLVNMAGRDTLPQLLALLGRASVLLTPDSGPAHMATMVGTPVIGLYAATRSARSGPYLSRQWCVDRYAEAARHFLGREPERIPWTAKIERAGVMDLIRPEDVTARLDQLLAQVRSGDAHGL